MTLESHHVTKTKHESRQTKERQDKCFCEESFIDRSLSVLEILKGGILYNEMATHAIKARGE